MPKTRIKKERKKTVHWDDRFYVQIYKLMVSGHNRKQIAEILGVSPSTLSKWEDDRPALADAMREAEAVRKPSDSFADYVYRQLPKELQAVWDELTELDDIENPVRMSEYMTAQPERVQKYLFIHALVTGRFNPSEACRKIGVSKRKYEKWCILDQEFAQLIEEVLWHKKNFCESALMQKVIEGDTSAVLFANKTVNRDRGYNEKTEIDFRATILNAHVDIDELGLNPETKRALLDSIRSKKLKDSGNLIDMIPIGEDDDVPSE